MDIGHVAAAAALGIVSGALAGLLGIGGGIVLVPGLAYVFEQRLGLPHDTAIKAAVATSLAVICFTSIASMRAHHRRGAVDWATVRRLVPGIAIGALLAARGASLLGGDLLVVAFSVFVLSSAVRLWRGERPSASAARTAVARAPARRLEHLAAGAVIGGAAALVGAGGAFVSVPYLRWRGSTIHQAIGTSAAIGLPVALAGALGYVHAGWGGVAGLAGASGFVGYVHLPTLAVVAAASMALAPVGARGAHALDRRRLERGFAVLLTMLAGWMLLRAAVG